VKFIWMEIQSSQVTSCVLLEISRASCLKYFVHSIQSLVSISCIILLHTHSWMCPEFRGLGSFFKCLKNILLTTDEKVLAKIASSMPEIFEDRDGKDEMDALGLDERPPTAGEMSPIKV
jgi:hypothetical protein